MRELRQGYRIAAGEYLEDASWPCPVFDVLALWGCAAEIGFGEVGRGEGEDQDCGVGDGEFLGVVGRSGAGWCWGGGDGI